MILILLMAGALTQTADESIRFKVMDDDPLGRDDLISWACFKYSRLQNGVRLIHLYDEQGQRTEGVLLVRIRKLFTPDGHQA